MMRFRRVMKTAAMAGRNEFAQRAVADHDLGAEANPITKQAAISQCHRRRRRSGQRCKPEDHQVERIGEDLRPSLSPRVPANQAPIIMPKKVAENKRAR